jgi:hypothetical protein
MPSVVKERPPLYPISRIESSTIILLRYTDTFWLNRCSGASVSRVRRSRAKRDAARRIPAANPLSFAATADSAVLRLFSPKLSTSPFSLFPPVVAGADRRSFIFPTLRSYALSVECWALCVQAFFQLIQPLLNRHRRGLHTAEIRVQTICRHQFLVRPAFDDIIYRVA